MISLLVSCFNMFGVILGVVNLLDHSPYTIFWYSVVVLNMISSVMNFIQARFFLNDLAKGIFTAMANDRFRRRK